MTTYTRHNPVLLHEVSEFLDVQAGDTVVDGTLGAGGHAAMLIDQLDDSGTFIGIDQDVDVLNQTTAELAEKFPTITMHTVCDNFRNLDAILSDLDITSFDKALFDLGVSSMQLDDPEYGMTFRQDAPLSMVMSKKTDDRIITAFDVVNEWKEETLAGILYAFGDERYSRRIARAIVSAREDSSIRTTLELADLVKNAVPKKYAHGKIHPATRTFQAIRIVVNDEYGAIKEGLGKAIDLLNTGGRIAVISFHSGEDRIVKHFFKEYIDNGIIQKINKKPVTPSDDEVKNNPRSRSSKLRVIEKK